MLLLHGFTKDAYTWFDRRRGDGEEPVLPAVLFYRGYDVWMGSIRGTRYSITHTTLDRDASNAQESAYFDYDATDVARNDIPAMVELIMREQEKLKEATGRPCKKINMIGHSHGAALMLASMSYTVKSDRYVSQMIGVEPCLLAEPDEYYPDLGYLEYELLNAAAKLFGFNSIFGPDWD